MRFLPPLVVEQADLERVVQAVGEVLSVGVAEIDGKLLTLTPASPKIQRADFRRGAR